MSRNNWFGPLFARCYGSALCDRQSSCERQSRLAVEPLELRAMLTTLTVDIGDPTANDPGDNLYAEIQEAVDAASPGDKIRVHAGTYQPFVVNTDNLTIREAHHHSNPVVDGNLNPGDENGVEVVDFAQLLAIAARLRLAGEQGVRDAGTALPLVPAYISP